MYMCYEYLIYYITWIDLIWFVFFCVDQILRFLRRRRTQVTASLGGPHTITIPQPVAYLSDPSVPSAAWTHRLEVLALSGSGQQHGFLGMVLEWSRTTCQGPSSRVFQGSFCFNRSLYIIWCNGHDDCGVCCAKRCLSWNWYTLVRSIQMYHLLKEILFGPYRTSCNLHPGSCVTSEPQNDEILRVYVSRRWVNRHNIL